MVQGMPILDHVDQVCDGCLIGKERRAPFPEQVRQQAEFVLELVRGDLCSPITPSTQAVTNTFFSLLMI
jgi:hypothetical protein